MSELVNRGADPNLPESDELGFTPLVSAAHNGHTETARILLENGADANLAAPIVYASRRGSLELVRALLQHGARPDPKAIHQAEKLAGADIDAHLRELARPAASDTVTIVREAKDDGTEIVRAHVARGPDVSSELTLETGHAAIAELLRSAQTA